MKVPKSFVLAPGQIFGKWTVIQFDKELGPYGKFKYYLCECICGNKVSVRSFDLLNGNSQCCGCINGRKRSDLSGKIVNGLIIIEEIEHKIWTVQCMCGKKFTAKSSQLSGKKAIQSCGCKTMEIIKSKSSSTEPYLTYLYSFYKNSAIKRKLSFQISLTLFEKLIKENCYFCNIEPFNVFDGTSYRNKFLHNGVDRI